MSSLLFHNLLDPLQISSNIFVNTNKKLQTINLQGMQSSRRYQPYQQGANKANRHGDGCKVNMLASLATQRAIQNPSQRVHQANPDYLTSNNGVAAERNKETLTAFEKLCKETFGTDPNNSNLNFKQVKKIKLGPSQSDFPMFDDKKIHYSSRNSPVDVKPNFDVKNHNLNVYSNKAFQMQFAASNNNLTQNVNNMALHGQQTYSKNFNPQQVYKNVAVRNNLNTCAHTNRKAVNEAFYRKPVYKVSQNDFLHPIRSKQTKHIVNQGVTNNELFKQEAGKVKTNPPIPNQHIAQQQTNQKQEYVYYQQTNKPMVQQQHYAASKHQIPAAIIKQYMNQSQQNLKFANASDQNQIFKPFVQQQQQQQPTMQNMYQYPPNIQSYNRARLPHQANHPQAANFYGFQQPPPVVSRQQNQFQIDDSLLIDSADKKMFRCSYELLNLIGEGGQGSVFSG